MRRVLLLLAMTLFPLSAAAEMPDSVTIGVDPRSYPPFYFFEDNNVTGLSVEITAAVTKRLGIELKHEEMHWNRVLLKVKEGELDGVYNLFRTPERETWLTFPSEHLYFEDSSFYTRKDKPIDYDGDLNGLRGMTIVGAENFSYGPDVDTAEYLNILRLKDDRQIVSMIMSGRGDVALGNTAVVYHWAKEMGRENDLLFMRPLATQQPTYTAFSRKRNLGAFVRAFSEELSKFKQTKDYKDILAKYGLE